MISFLFSIVVLILGYFTCVKFMEKIFGVQEARKTPAYRLRDDVDFISPAHLEDFFDPVL